MALSPPSDQPLQDLSECLHAVCGSKRRQIETRLPADPCPAEGITPSRQALDLGAQFRLHVFLIEGGMVSQPRHAKPRFFPASSMCTRVMPSGGRRSLIRHCGPRLQANSRRKPTSLDQSRSSRAAEAAASPHAACTACRNLSSSPETSSRFPPAIRPSIHPPVQGVLSLACIRAPIRIPQSIAGVHAGSAPHKPCRRRSRKTAKGNRKGFWAVDVAARDRIIFRFEGNHVCEIQLVDYH